MTEQLTKAEVFAISGSDPRSSTTKRIQTTEERQKLKAIC